MNKPTQAAAPDVAETPAHDLGGMNALMRALGDVKAKKAALDKATADMQAEMAAQQAKVETAQAAHSESQRAAQLLHDAFKEQVAALLPGSTRTRSA